MPQTQNIPAVGETVERSYRAEVTTRSAGDAEEDDPIIMRFSNGDTVDAHGTAFDMAGADLSRFRSNPIVRWAHGKDETVGRMPIARATRVYTSGGDLVARLQFDDQDEAARKVESKLRRGYLNAGSIAAAPQSPPETRQIGGEEAVVFTDWELRGLSIVDIPSDEGALAVSRSAPSSGSPELSRQQVVEIATRVFTRVRRQKRRRQRRRLRRAIERAKRSRGPDRRLQRWIRRHR